MVKWCVFNNSTFSCVQQNEDNKSKLLEIEAFDAFFIAFIIAIIERHQLRWRYKNRNNYDEKCWSPMTNIAFVVPALSLVS